LIIKMIQDSKGMANKNGNVSMVYNSGKIYNMKEDWQKPLAEVFINEGWAVLKTIKNKED